MIQEDITQIINNNNPTIDLKCQLVKQYIFDKTNTNIIVNYPSGAVYIINNNVLLDYDLLEYFYFCCCKYYKNKMS